MPETCVVEDLGLVPYAKAWEYQKQLSAAIARGERLPTLLLLEHPHTYTFGRRGQAENLLLDEAELQRGGIDVYWVDRGGDVTYHGPGQLVGYPLLPLAPGGVYSRLTDGAPQARLPNADYVGYLRRLEQALILALERLMVLAFPIAGKTGVWVDERESGSPAKIASIGVKVDAQGITQHGFALNVNPDMSFWQGIIACGLPGSQAVCLAELLDPLPNPQTVRQSVVDAFGIVFDYKMIYAKHP
jgi:lipoate-protein ligase B